MTGVGRKLVQIMQLGAAVAFAKWMHVVHIAENVGRFACKVFPTQSVQETLVYKAFVHIGHAGFDKLAELKLLAAFLQFDGAWFARPRINVLEQMAVDGFKMRQIEVARRNTLAGPLCHKLTFAQSKRFRVAKAELVSKNVCAGIGVRVVAHSAAWLLGLARASRYAKRRS